MKTKIATLVLAVLACGGVARADDPAGTPPAPAQSGPGAIDVVTLKDGRRLEGEIVAEDDRYISLRSGGVTRAYAKDTVATVEKSARAPAASSPGAPSAPPGATPEVPGKEKRKNKGPAKDGPLSDAAKAWLDQLIAKSADADEAVRRSIGAAIGAMGPAAIPALRAAEEAAPEGPQKGFLGRIASDMESRRDKKMRGEPPMPGEGMGPDGMPGEMPGMPPRERGPGRGLDDLVQRLSDDLELREDQKPKVRGFLEDSMKKRFALFRDARRDGLSAEQVAEKVTPLRADLLVQMKTVLDEPQYAMFEEMAQRLFEAQKGPMGPPPMKPGEPKDPPK